LFRIAKIFFGNQLGSGVLLGKSVNISLSSPTSINSVTASALSVGAGWVSVKNSSGTIVAKYNVEVDAAPAILSHSLPMSASATNNAVVLSITASTMVSANEISWTRSPQSNSDIQPIGNPVLAAFCKTGSYSVSASASNRCGTTTRTQNISITINGFYNGGCDVPYMAPPPPPSPGNDHNQRSCNCSVSVYPNPVTDIFTVEIGQETSENDQGYTYDLLLYDGQGNLLRRSTTQSNTVEFNVSNLPDGIYYLHVYDGVNSTPVMQQVMIEH